MNWEEVKNMLLAAKDDYGQLFEKDRPLAKDANLLMQKLSRNVPSNADFRNPQAMSQWAQAAALNAPMGLHTMTQKQLNAVLKQLKTNNPSTLPKIPSGNVFKNQVSEAPMGARIAADDYFSNGKASQQNINIADIYPTQRNINIDNLKKINSTNEAPNLIKIGEKYYVTDGHHRISRDILSGDSSILGNVFNYGMGE